MKLHWLVLVVIFATKSVLAQTLDDNVKMFRDSVLHERFILRGYSGAARVYARWDGQNLLEERPYFREFSLLEIGAVRLKNGKLEIEAKRLEIFKGENGTQVLPDTHRVVTVEVTAADGDWAGLLPDLKRRLFYASLDDATAHLPARLAHQLPVTREMPKVSRKQQAADPTACDCKQQECAPDSKMLNQKMPRPVVTPDPKMPDEARIHTFSDTVEGYLQVTEKGGVEDLWIIRSAEYGTVESAAAAMLRYKFEPASCHDKAVAVGIFVDVKFERF